MANRVLRDWTTSEKIDSLSELGELFFVRLIMKADDHGCFHANAKLLKAALFPLKDYSFKQMDICVKELKEMGIIQVYESEGRQYLKIIDFGQRLRNMRSSFPQPADNPLTIDGNKPPETKRNEVETESETETNRVDFDVLFLQAFDEITCEGYKLAFKNIDLGGELQKFKVKCDNDKVKYHDRDVGGLRTAFQYQLQNLRKSNGKHGTDKQQHSDSIKDTIRNTYGYSGPK